MVFSAIHGSDPKDSSTVTTPFEYDRSVRLASLRIGVDPNAPKELVDKLRELGMRPREIGARPTVPGLNSGLNVESASAFDAYVVRKAQEIGLDLTKLPEPARPGAPATPPATPPTTPANPMAPADWNPRFVNGRMTRAIDFVQAQRRRYVLVQRWAEFMKDLDMFIAAPSADVGANAQTGHPCVVVPYKFDVPQQGQGGGANPQPRLDLKAQPICATIVGGLYHDDKILAVAHRFQSATDIHLRRPSL